MLSPTRVTSPRPGKGPSPGTTAASGHLKDFEFGYRRKNDIEIKLPGGFNAACFSDRITLSNFSVPP